MIVDSKPSELIKSSGDFDSHQTLLQIDAIQKWLIAQIASMQSIDPAEIDIREPLSSYGLGSVAALTLSGDLETLLKRRLEPTLVWDYPTIQRLSEYLVSDFCE